MNSRSPFTRIDPDEIIPIGTGIECSAIKGRYPAPANEMSLDACVLMKHVDKFEHDLRLIQQSGIKTLRYPIPWHRIEWKKGHYDWSWMDRAMELIQDLELEVIADPLHHTSFPNWLTEGFADDDFVKSYVAFVTAFVRRYPWVTNYAVINEPFVTTFFCGHEGIWYPYHRGREKFIRMLVNVCRAITSVSRYLVEEVPDVMIIHIDTCESHRTEMEEHLVDVAHRNDMRFLLLDLILGKVDETHALYHYMLEGATEGDLKWFHDHPSPVHVIGLDYYQHSEFLWGGAGGECSRVWPTPAPLGFASVAFEYYQRYQIPLRLTETNIRGFISDRISWMKYILSECCKLKRQLPQGMFLGADWFPFIDCTDWDSLIRKPRGHIDPQGIFWLDEHWNRHRSEFTSLIQKLARGEITWREMPAYRFDPILTGLRGFKRFMADWDWINPGEAALPISADLMHGERRVRETSTG